MALGLMAPEDDKGVAVLSWRHALAIGYALEYRAEHADGLGSDWPRVPLPNSTDLLRASASPGERESNAKEGALLDALKLSEEDVCDIYLNDHL